MMTKRFLTRIVALALLALYALPMSAFTVLLCTIGGDVKYSSESISSIKLLLDGSADVYFNDGNVINFSEDEFLSLGFDSRNSLSAPATSQLSVSLIDGVLSVPGHNCFDVYDRDGQLCASAHDGQVLVSSLPCGVYLVKAGKLISKIVVK